MSYPLISLILFHYDFIALQEVLDLEVIRRIQQIFEKDFQVNYAVEVSDPVGRSRQERYAFLWRTDKILQTQAGAFYGDPGDRFVRLLPGWHL